MRNTYERVLAATRACVAAVLAVALLGALPVSVSAQGGFDFPDFTSIAGIALNGSASQIGSIMRLTPAAPEVAGSAWYAGKQVVGGGFRTEFTFRITRGGADGFAFLIQNHDLAALGTVGGGIGYSGFPNSVAVEFDTWNNAVAADPNGNHISVHTGGPLENNGRHENSLGADTTIPLLADGGVHAAAIEYSVHDNKLKVFLDDPVTPRLVVGLDLSATLLLDDGAAWVGFTAATGGVVQSHDILSWTFALPNAPTRTYAPDREAVIGETVTLRGYLKRLLDNAWLPGRTIEFAIDGARVGAGTTDASGHASLGWVIPDGAATRSIAVSFRGDAAYLPSTTTATLVAQTHSTETFITDRLGDIADTVLLRAYLYRQNTHLSVCNKTLTFSVDGVVLGPAVTNGNGRAQLVYVVPPAGGAGDRVLTADWGGDGGYRASGGSATLHVAKAPAYLWFASRSATRGTLTYLRAYLRSLPDYAWLPGKAIRFALNGTDLGMATTDVGGRASYLFDVTSAWPLGDLAMWAAFDGDGTYLPHGSSAVLTVMP